MPLEERKETARDELIFFGVLKMILHICSVNLAGSDFCLRFTPDFCSTTQLSYNDTIKLL